MAEPLKNLFGPEMVHRAARSIAAACDLMEADSFDADSFTAQALDSFDDLELTPRCQQIAESMASHLPADADRAIEILLASLGPELENCDPADASPIGDPEIDDNVMSGFFYMPHGYFLADLANRPSGEEPSFEQVMRANYEITKRATSEFSIRTPLRDNTEATLVVLRQWASDENVHVRRLVSEGTRPRLPWSFRLKVFQDDPLPVIELLELLKDDPVEYVRRSVANNLNDIAKDHPGLVVDVARRWCAEGDAQRRRLVRHALRTLIKAGDPGALDVLGYGASSPARVTSSSIEPSEVAIGEKVKISLTLANPTDSPAGALVDVRVHFVKANGSTSPKVFKGAEVTIDASGEAVITKTVSVAQHTTRTHYAGEHIVDAMINGRIEPIGSFTLRAG